MASSSQLAKRRRLNSPLHESPDEDDDYVCYGMVSPTLHQTVTIYDFAKLSTPAG
jgi:hypothetical protein